MKVKINSFGPIISEKSIGAKIYDELSLSLKNKEVINVDFVGVVSMATFCAKQIFGRLYIEMGPDRFFERVKLLNVSEDLQIIIKMGIQSAIEENNSN
ncbi:MAG: STAS-like domain-containing protein [Paludibacter sp.]